MNNIDFNKPYIYRRKIIATEKFYVGKHKGGNKYYKGSGKEYKEDLKKYKETELEILEYVEDVSLLNAKEIFWLEKFHAATNPLYYNKTNKPFGPLNHTENWKKEQSDKMKGKSTTKGKTWIVQDTSNMVGGGAKGKTWKCKSPRSEELKQKIKEKLTNRDISSWKHKIYTEERNNNISKSKGQGIIQLDLKGNFIKEWISYGEVYKAGYKGIQGAIKRNKPYLNYIWKLKKDYLY
jgi:hypothetical protein